MINKGFTRFGGGGDALVTPVGFLLLLLAVILMFSLSRRQMIIPLLCAIILIPMSQRIVVAGLHFTSMRMLVMFAWIRIMTASFNTRVEKTRIDKLFILWALSGGLTFTLLWANTDALINRVGVLYDCFGMYFLLRVLVQGQQSIDRVFKVMSALSLFLGVCLLEEHLRGINLFYLLGGVDKISDVREGHIRAQGPFAHAILAGCFGATLMPLFAGFWFQGRLRAVAVMGMVGATLMTFSTSSSTAILAWAAGIAALLMWPVRPYMRAFRWSIVLTLCGLQLTMKAPVWALIGRTDLAGGSSGYHRFELVNQTILHFSEWWLLGEKTTYQWGYNLWDTANTYVETAVTGGLTTLVFFVTMIVFCFKAIGKVVRFSRDPEKSRMAWTLGATLVAHLVAFVGISYYDQTIVAWYLLLAMICAVTTSARRSRSASAKRDVGTLPEALNVEKGAALTVS